LPAKLHRFSSKQLIGEHLCKVVADTAIELAYPASTFERALYNGDTPTAEDWTYLLALLWHVIEVCELRPLGLQASVCLLYALSPPGKPPLTP
jgi:hypothetical protein